MPRFARRFPTPFAIALTQLCSALLAPALLHAQDVAKPASPVALTPPVAAMGAGHGGRSGRYEALHDEAFRYAFVLDVIGAGAGGAVAERQ